MADDAKLAAALKQAKQTPMLFAFVAKGTTDGVLMVAKMKIPAKEIDKAKKECGGKTVFRGRCVFEDPKLVFEMAKEPPGTLAKQLKLVIQASAGMIMQVETRVAPDLQEEGDEHESAEAGAIPPAPPLTPAQTPPQQDPAAAQVAARIKALVALVQRLIALKHPSANEAKLALGEANTQFRAQQYADANATLDRATALIKNALAAAAAAAPAATAAPAAPPAPPAPPSQNDPAAAPADEFEELYNGLLTTVPGDLQQLAAANAAAAATIQKIVDGAQGFAQKGDFKRAYTFLDQASKALAKALGAGRAQEAAAVIPAGTVAEMVDRLSRAQSRWDAALSEAQSRIKPLQAEMKATFPDTAVELGHILDSYWQELFDVLTTAKAQNDQDGLAGAVGTVLGKVQVLQTEVLGDKLLSYLEGCGVKVKSSLINAFEEVESLLQA